MSRGRIPTEELEERIDFAYKLLCRRLYKSDIKRALKQRYSMPARTCEDYIARARERIVAETGESKPEHRAKSLAFYESVLADPEEKAADRIRAQERIDKLLGLEEPAECVIKGDKSNPLVIHVVETVVTSREEAKAILALPQPALNGHTNGHAR
jgi:hypothetical protein